MRINIHYRVAVTMSVGYAACFAQTGGHQGDVSLHDTFGFRAVLSSNEVDRFRVAMPRIDSGGECVVSQTPLNGTTLLAYYPSRDSARTVVTIVRDDHSNPLYYREDRGDVHDPSSHVPLTVIQMDFTSGAASAGNKGTDSRDGIVGALSLFANSQNLGTPTDHLHSVITYCERR